MRHTPPHADGPARGNPKHSAPAHWRVTGFARLALAAVLAAGTATVFAQPAPVPVEETPAVPADDPQDRVAAPDETAPQPELVEDIVDQALRLADLPATGNTPTHFLIAGLLILAAVALRRVVVRWVFAGLRRLARRTRWSLDDDLLAPMEGSLKAVIVVIGVTGALSVLKLPPAAERALAWGYVVAYSVVALAFFLRVTGALLDRVQVRAREQQLNVASFMPWIRRVVLAVIFVLGVLMIIQSLGGNVRAILAGLGIGGLAVALAAQDTLANIFGSIVIAIDQPFRLGDFVQIGPNAGAVEDVGLRSTRLRTAQRNLIVIPNKNVAAEPIINLSRFIQRRVEQTFRLNHDATPEQMEGLVEDIRALVSGEGEVDPNSIIVQFTDFGPSSLDVWLAYNTLDPDFVKHLKLKQRLNLAIMRAVAARGMRFALPAQRVHLADTGSPGRPREDPGPDATWR